MRDLVILAVTAAFFALCVAYVRWCDHIIGPDPETFVDEADASVELDDDADALGTAAVGAVRS
jgi:hypothetical protein